MGFPEDSSGHVDVSPLVSVCRVRRRADLYLRRNFRAHIKSAPAIAYTQPLLKIAIETRVQYKVGFAGPTQDPTIEAVGQNTDAKCEITLVYPGCANTRGLYQAAARPVATTVPAKPQYNANLSIEGSRFRYPDSS